MNQEFLPGNQVEGDHMVCLPMQAKDSQFSPINLSPERVSPK